MTTIFVPNNDLDSITRQMFAGLEATGRFIVIIAGPGEDTDAPSIKSKIDIRAIRAYRRLLKKFRPDVIFSTSTSGLSTMLFASMGLGMSNVGYRGTQAKVRRSDPFNYLALLNPRVKHVVCETADIEDSLGHLLGRTKVSTATKPFKLEWVDDALAKPAPYPGKNPGALKLITVGMFDGRPHKGLNILLDAMKILDGRPVELTVVGKVSEADQAKATKNVTFTGKRNDAAALMAAHDLYILPSLRDASPRTLREAQAVGIPCIVSDIPGARDLIEDGLTGRLIQPGSPEKLAEAIQILIDNRDELNRMAANTRTFIQQNFSMDDYIDYHAKLFETIK